MPSARSWTSPFFPTCLTNTALQRMRSVARIGRVLSSVLQTRMRSWGEKREPFASQTAPPMTGPVGPPLRKLVPAREEPKEKSHPQRPPGSGVAPTFSEIHQLHGPLPRIRVVYWYTGFPSYAIRACSLSGRMTRNLTEQANLLETRTLAR